MTVYGSDAKFSATWTNVGDFLARIGLQFDQTKTPAQIGTISADFAETKTGGNNGLVYVGIYGWTVEPAARVLHPRRLGRARSPAARRPTVRRAPTSGRSPSTATPTTSGRRRATNKPNITGDRSDVRSVFQHPAERLASAGTSPSPSTSRKWTSLGLQLGKLVEAKLLVEAQDSTGTIDFTTATVIVK